MPQEMLLAAIVASAVSIFIAVLFAHAGISKWLSPEAYRETVAALLGERRAIHAVRLIASVEIAVSVIVLLPISRGLGLLAACALLATYAGVMLIQLKQGNTNLRCGCSGPSSDTRISSELIWRNLLLAGGALWATTGVVLGQLEATAVAAGLSLVLGFVYAAVDQLIQNRQLWLRGVSA